MQRLSMLAAGNNKNRNSNAKREVKEAETEGKPPVRGGALADLEEQEEARDAAPEESVEAATVAEKQPEEGKEEEDAERPSNNGPVDAPVAEGDQVEGLTRGVCPCRP